MEKMDMFLAKKERTSKKTSNFSRRNVWKLKWKHDVGVHQQLFFLHKHIFLGHNFVNYSVVFLSKKSCSRMYFLPIMLSQGMNKDGLPFCY